MLIRWQLWITDRLSKNTRIRTLIHVSSCIHRSHTQTAIYQSFNSIGRDQQCFGHHSYAQFTHILQAHYSITNKSVCFEFNIFHLKWNKQSAKHAESVKLTRYELVTYRRCSIRSNHFSLFFFSSLFLYFFGTPYTAWCALVIDWVPLKKGR